MPRHNIPDEITERLRGEDVAALGELYVLCEDRLRQMVHYRLDNRLTRRVDVDDILQEAFIDAEQRLSHFAKTSEEASPYIWLRLVTLQTLQDVHRKHLGTKARDVTREHTTGSAAADATRHSLADLLVGQLTSPSQAIQRAEAMEQIQAALSQMSNIDQEILALRHFEELSNSEVAEVLSIETGAASLRYMRALKRLQQAIASLPESGRSW